MNATANGSACTEFWDSDYNQCVPWDDVPALIWDYLRPEWYEILFLLLFSLVFVCGVIGNSLVCVVIWRHRDMRTVTNVFILNLALADLLVLLLVLFPTALQDIFESWFFSVVGCKIFKFIQRVSVLVSVLTLTVISVERYCAISNPLKFRSTLKRAGLLIVAVWVLAMIASSPDLYYYKSYAEFPSNITSFLVRCKGSHPDGLVYLYPVAFFVLPFLIMAIAYTKIARCLWTSDVGQLSASERCSDQGVASQLAQRRKIARMLMAVVVCFFCCYLPHYFVFLWGDLVEVHNEDLYYAMVTAGHLLIYVNSAVNPIIYNFMSERFRQGFLDVCVCCQRFRKPLSDNTVLRPLRDSSPYHDETKVSEI